MPCGSSFFTILYVFARPMILSIWCRFVAILRCLTTFCVSSWPFPFNIRSFYLNVSCLYPTTIIYEHKIWMRANSWIQNKPQENNEPHHSNIKMHFFSINCTINFAHSTRTIRSSTTADDYKKHLAYELQTFTLRYTLCKNISIHPFTRLFGQILVRVMKSGCPPFWIAISTEISPFLLTTSAV